MINEVHKHRMAIFTCEATRYFSEKVVAAMNRLKGPEDPEVVLGPLEVTHFSDGEFVPFFAESVRGATCFILQSTFPPTDNLMELLLSIDAAKRASANKVIAVIPYFGWARQDRKDKPRVSIGAKLVANMIKAAGADAIMTCDLHADQIQGFFDLPVNHLYASYDFLGILRKMQKADPERFTIAAPDMGGAKRANAGMVFFNSAASKSAVISVAIKPGATALTVISRAAISLLSAFVAPMIAAFAAA